MNDILKKRIEKGMADYADNLYPKYFPQHSIARAAFPAGAEYALSHQWIRMDEACPNDNEICLFIDNHDKMQLLTMDDIRKQHEIWDAMLLGISRDLIEESICRLDKIIAWLPIPKFEPKESK